MHFYARMCMRGDSDDFGFVHFAHIIRILCFWFESHKSSFNFISDFVIIFYVITGNNNFYICIVSRSNFSPCFGNEKLKG